MHEQKLKDLLSSTLKVTKCELKKSCALKRSYKCQRCCKKERSVHDLNERHRKTHPPLLCSDCNCAVPFTRFIVGMQTSRESGEIPPVWRPVRVCMVDYLKSDQLEAVNHGEEYLRGTFEFHRQSIIQYISYHIYVMLF